MPREPRQKSVVPKKQGDTLTRNIVIGMVALVVLSGVIFTLTSKKSSTNVAVPSAIGQIDSRPVSTVDVLSHEQLRRIQQSVASTAIAENVLRYLVRLAQETRRHPSINLGLSPRGLLIWQRVAQARAWLSGRNFVTPDDVQDVAGPVLSVRIGLDPQESAAVIQEILDRVPVPEIGP